MDVEGCRSPTRLEVRLRVESVVAQFVACAGDTECIVPAVQRNHDNQDIVVASSETQGRDPGAGLSRTFHTCQVGSRDYNGGKGVDLQPSGQNGKSSKFGGEVDAGKGRPPHVP